LAAFGIIAVVYNQTGSEAVNDFKGFYKKKPSLAWVFALALFSLAGIPPMAGFLENSFLYWLLPEA
ncbi:MAG: proton-conducting transporter membrane subunit, partial [Ferruginibacter sp.]